ncbi:MAG TPA: hypothetical protein ENJ82_11710 [Bacteroidetes bacterium]|nr:hypothetical protein [Bacteroidota bacterium]
MANFPLLKHRITLSLLLLAVSLIMGCYKTKKVITADGKEVEVLDAQETTTYGEINIGIDEMLAPVMRQEVMVFMELFPEGILHPFYKPEGELIRGLLDDSLRMIIIGRELRADEAAQIRQDKIRPTITQIGKAAIALVGHPSNPIDSLTENQLGQIMRGELSNWAEIGGKDEAINIVFDHPQSGVVSFVQNRFMNEGDSLPANAFTAMSTEKVVDYVAQAPNALGLVGVSWVADRDEPQVRDFLSRVRLVRMQTPDTSDLPGVWVRPYQNEIELDRWPLTHGIYAVSREHFSGLGTGFVVFVAGERGQRILLKAGVMPAYMPPRVVIFPEKEEKDK